MMTLRRRSASGLFAVVLAAASGGPLTAADTDATAGTWQMLVLTSPQQIAVAAPLSASGADYQAEIAALKAAQRRLTAAQRRAITYWGHGGVLRWNEIVLELASRYNLPPAPHADGTYPAPDANNPFADPQFPFANPPYAARAYSYLSVAQYEALKVAWHYKFLYNRPQPLAVDGQVQSLMPATDLPGYPSEDAVVSAVSAEILKLMFPAAVEYITAKAAEQRQSAMLAGRAATSDLTAGIAIGQAVAALLVARASTDGMRTAGGSPALWQALRDTTAARGEIPWISRETPERPPMLPLFGNVRPWMMTAADLVRERPPAPPSTSSPLMAREVDEVRRTVRNLSREELAIAIKWADGPSTPTPPGHWNFIAADYIKAAQYSEVRTARALALIDMALHDAAVGCWDAKYFYFNPRPSQMDPQIRTAIGLPNFPSYTSGHSTFSAAAAEVLSYLFPEGRASFDQMKNEAGISRLYGGIHFSADIEMGKAHGVVIGQYTVRFALGDGAGR